MRKTFLFILSIFTSLAVFSQEQVLVDFDMSGRSSSEVNEPGYEPWVVTGCTEATKEINGVNFKVAIGANAQGASFKTNWYKAGIQSPHYARLVSDGITLQGIDTPAEIDLVISGLTPGKHTLLTYHNTVDNPTAIIYGAIDIYVNNKLYIEGMEQTARALSTYLAATAYITFEVDDSKEVTISFRSAKNNPEDVSKNLMINGFALDVSNVAKQAKYPSPSHLDLHVDADDGTYLLSWEAATTAVKHHLYLGTDAEQLTGATPESACYKGSFTETTYQATDLYSMNTYYWRVDEVEANGTITQGEVWSFMPRQLAFPGAEGYGRFARGGRGGKVVYVTNLNDDGPGSLREAITNDVGPRTILFAVSGLIPLESRLTLGHSNVTIAGQSAPGKGICVKGATLGFSGAKDCIMRFMRVRIGLGDTYDASGMTGSDNCIFDHNSFSWSLDEVFSSRSGKNFTLQRTMLSEALNIAGHKNYPEGTEHGYAASIGGDIGSFHHNLLAHCAGRNWSLAGGLDGAGAYAGRLDIFNNVVYNWRKRTTDGGAHEVNFVGNYYKKGASTQHTVLLTAQLEGAGTGSQSYYTADNMLVEANGTVVYNGSNPSQGREYKLTGGQVLDWEVWRDKPFFESYATIEKASDAYKSVLSDVGCTMPVFDEHDVRMIHETLTGTYSYVGSKSGYPGLPDSHSDVGGWEEYPEIHLNLDEYDTDRDGLPNWWEEMFGLNPYSAEGDFSDTNSDDNKDGYTQLDYFLHWLSVPHFTAELGTAVQIELTPFTRGYINAPQYSIANIDQGITAKIDKNILTITPDQGFGGIAYIDFKVTDADGSSMTRTLGLKVGTKATGIHSMHLQHDKKQLNVYPNPVDDKLTIQLSQTGKATLSLYDIYGKQVFSDRLDVNSSLQYQVDISALSSGVYLLKMTQGESIETVKVIKK